MAYIKLGTKGKVFNSKKYNVYLSKENAAVISDVYLYGDLARFIITGYFLEIDKNEYENIQLNQNNNAPLNYVPNGVNTISVVEPVEEITKGVNPGNISIGSRYIVDKSPSLTEWLGLAGNIVEWNGISWVVTRPTDQLIVPVKSLGVAATYIGTHPSGYWFINENDLTNYIDEIIDDQPDLDDLIVRSPNKTNYRITVSDTGQLGTEKVTT